MQHLLLTDRDGITIVEEYTKGKCLVPCPVLANDLIHPRTAGTRRENELLSVKIVGIMSSLGVMRLGSTAGLVRGDWELFILREAGYADSL